MILSIIRCFSFGGKPIFQDLLNEKVAEGDALHPHDFIKHDKRHLEYRPNENNNKHQSINNTKTSWMFGF